MAKQENNIVMRNASGMFGRQVVFRQRAGKTILAAPPTVDPDRPVRAEEQEVRDKFAAIGKHAKAAVKDPSLAAAYLAVAKPGQTAFNVAFADAYYPPEILDVNIANYNGAIGNIIAVQAVDNVQGKSVRVEIRSAVGIIIEQGNALPTTDGITWNYTATTANADVAGARITAIATDLAGNETIMEGTL